MRRKDGTLYQDKSTDMCMAAPAVCGYCGNKTRFHHRVLIKTDDLKNDNKRVSTWFYLCARCQILFDKALEDIIYD